MPEELTGVGTEAELKTALKTITTRLREGAEKGIKVEGENVEVTADDAKALRADFAKAGEIKGFLEIYEMMRDPKTLVDTEPANNSVAIRSAVKSLMDNGNQFKDIGTAFTNSEEFKELVATGGATMRRPYEANVFDLSSLGYKDVYNSLGNRTITHGFGSIQFDPMVPRGQRPTRVRDLFPVATTTSNLIDFFQVLGFAENNALANANVAVVGGSGAAASVPDYVVGSPGNFGLKPKSNLQFRPNQAPVRTIAHWEAAHRNALDDEPQLQAVINNELLYGLSLIEDYQILLGGGTGEDLLGILNTPNIQTYTAPVGGELYSDSLRRAATLSILAYYPSNGYVLHPTDWEKTELQRPLTGDGQYMLFSNIAVGAQTQVWRQPVVESPVMTAGKFLSGAFGTGAQLYDRQVANIRIAEQHSDFFVRNAVAVLAEERLALAVKRPESFIKGTFVPIP